MVMGKIKKLKPLVAICLIRKSVGSENNPS